MTTALLAGFVITNVRSSTIFTKAQMVTSAFDAATASIRVNSELLA